MIHKKYNDELYAYLLSRFKPFFFPFSFKLFEIFSVFIEKSSKILFIFSKNFLKIFQFFFSDYENSPLFFIIFLHLRTKNLRHPPLSETKFIPFHPYIV